MSGLLPTRAKVSPSTARNRHPILEVLRPRLPPAGFVLEIAAGSGEHAVYNAAAFPNLNWQPTDKDLAVLAADYESCVSKGFVRGRLAVQKLNTNTGAQAADCSRSTLEPR